MGVAGHVLLILTESIALLVWALLFAVLTFEGSYEGNHAFDFLLCDRT